MSINSLLSRELELILIGSVVLWQAWLALKLFYQIVRYKKIFHRSRRPEIAEKAIALEDIGIEDVHPLLQDDNYFTPSEEESETITYLKTSKKEGKVLGTITEYINRYLVRNRSAGTDYHLISDIVNKHVEAEQNQIENRLPAPLYLGLAATMIGIIIGLSNINFAQITGSRSVQNEAAAAQTEVSANETSNDTEQPYLESGDSLSAIEPLIKGVRLAMFASVFGLILTTILSVFVFKSAQARLDKDKSEFLSLLQSELMPKMAMGDLPEVTTLSKKLDKFSRTTSSTIKKLGDIVRMSKENIEQEADIVQQLNGLNLEKLTHANSLLLTQLQTIVRSFDDFVVRYDQLNSSLSGTAQLAALMNEMLRRSDGFSESIKSLTDGVESGREATEFFNKHIKSFGQYGDAVRSVVADNDSAIRKATSELSESIENQFTGFSGAAAEFDGKLRGAFSETTANFTRALEQQTDKAVKTMAQGVPKFEKFDKLDHLEGIRDSFDALSRSNREILDRMTTENESTNALLKEIRDGLGGAQTINQKSSLDWLKIATYTLIISYVLVTFFFWLGVL